MSLYLNTKKHIKKPSAKNKSPIVFLTGFVAAISFILSMLYFWFFYTFYFKWNFNALGRYYNENENVVYTDDNAIWISSAIFFLLISLWCARKAHTASKKNIDNAQETN